MSEHAKEVSKLLAKIKNGEHSQFERLVDLTYGHLRIVAKIYLKDKSFFDDVVFEAYERVYTYISSFDESKDGYNWLCKIVQRTAYSYNEKDKFFDKSEAEPTLDEMLNRIDERHDLFVAIDKLDRSSKAIILMYFYMDLTLEEIGMKLGITKSAVHKRLKSILKSLKVMLKENTDR